MIQIFCGDKGSLLQGVQGRRCADQNRFRVCFGLSIRFVVFRVLWDDGENDDDVELRRRYRYGVHSTCYNIDLPAKDILISSG